MLGIALEGGGARCAAQAGALAALASRGYHPDVVAGCGAGAWVAGMHAVGVRGEAMKRMIHTMQKTGPWVLRARKAGLSMALRGGVARSVLCGEDGARLLKTLQWQTMNVALTDVKMPLAIPVFDIDASDELMLASQIPCKPSSLFWNRNASLAQAIAAGLTTPGIMPPQNWRGRSLIGGACRFMTLPDALTDLGATRIIKIRVLTAKEAGMDVVTLSQAASLPRDFEDSGLLRIYLPSAFTTLNFDCVDASYEIGYKTCIDQMPRLAGLIFKRQDNILQFPIPTPQ